MGVLDASKGPEPEQLILLIRATACRGLSLQLI